MSAAERWVPADPDTGPDVYEYRGDPADVIEAYGDLLDAIHDRPAWYAQAACRGMGPDIFFPARGESTNPAKEVCLACPVREDCLNYALSTPSFEDYWGVWGGLSGRQRRQLRRERRQEIEGDRSSPLNSDGAVPSVV